MSEQILRKRTGSDRQAAQTDDVQFAAADLITVTPDLYFSRRGSSVLIVEPESASWCVLTQPEWMVFNRIRGAPPGSDAEILGRALKENPGGSAYGSIAYKETLTSSQFHQLIRRLSLNNMVSVNGTIYYQPLSMWNTPKYPHYYNLHLTEACNLACTYCRVSSPGKAPMMTPETCRLIVRRTAEELPLDHVIVGFHGGEPMLNMKAVEAGAAEAKDAANRLNKTISLSLQTNGTLFSHRNLAVLKELEIDVGVSIDGPAHIHDRNRVLRSGKGSHWHVRRGIRAAVDADLHTGYLAVVHQPEDYLEVLDYMVRDLGATGMRINWTSMEGRAEEYLDFPVERAEMFAREWLKMIDRVEVHHKDTGIWLDVDDVNVFVFHLLSKHRPQMCYCSPCGIGNAILGFSHDGRIYLCDEAVGNSRFLVGSIHDPTPLTDLLDNSPVIKSTMEARKVENISRCSSCPWRRFHGAGCTTKTYAAYGTLNKESPMCRFFHVIFEELMWRLWNKPELSHLAGRFNKNLTDQEKEIALLRT